ncbi:hypothetical protein [Nocardia sp. BMG111209]|uniref:hypothetical protein n=1 Tax=Nocardia sp. BMG111209 TaxID=1160137 RepID=UPI00035F5840|nr:hypothetical protein [Nocardia sp. BMG111209]
MPNPHRDPGPQGSVDDILDYGSYGLRYFLDFYPQYCRVFGPIPEIGSGTAGFERVYDQERGMDLVGLAGLQQQLTTALSGASEQWDVQRQLLNGLPDVWSGGRAADTVTTGWSDRISAAEQDLRHAQQAAAAIGAATTALRSAVYSKAAATLELLEQGEATIGGKTPEDVRGLVDEYLTRRADEWLRSTFKPDVENKTRIFIELCRRTRGAIEQHYGLVAQALNDLPDPAATVGSFAERPDPTHPPSADRREYSRPGTPHIPDIVNGLAALSPLANAAESLLSGLGTAIGQGAGELPDLLRHGADQFTTVLDQFLGAHPIPADPGAPATEFDIAGRHLKLAVADGTLHVDLTDGDDHKIYTVTLDDHGNPVITTENHATAAPEPPPDTPGPQDRQSPTDRKPQANNDSPNPADPRQPPPQRQPQPQPQPDSPPADGHSPTSASPFDSGADLSEAGPL